MATTIYDEPWSPSDINCNWKPEKLARYSFVTNMIDFYAAGVQLGYGQSGIAPREDSTMNLTDYIEVEDNYNYFVKYKNGLELGVRFICFFDSNKTFLYSKTVRSEIDTSLEMGFVTPLNCSYIRITMFVQAWEKCSLRVSSSDSLVSGSKDSTPLNIVDNKTDTQIYKDTHFEVYVKAEALIKNFVDSFDLSAFQAFPDSGDSSYYSPTNSLLFAASNPSYYLEFVYENFIENHFYKEGDRMKFGGIYCVHKSPQSHTSAATFTAEMQINGAYWLVLPNSGNWLKVNQNIKEINYNENLGFPYVGYLLFKNLWGCDMANYLETFVNKAYLTLTYKKFFAKNLRINEIGYDKFFDQGYFDNAANYSSVEGFGVRLIRGEDFRNDEILGDFITNNYVTYTEKKHEIDENWEAANDYINSSLFGGNLTKPFDHYYKILPETGVPFFKEKTFNDFKVECTLQKEDILGNIFKRVIKLPICVKFHNNLIKCYFRNNHSDSLGKYYDAEYLNSHQENYYSVTKGEGDVVSRVTIWCPNVNKLSVSSRIIGPLFCPAAPAIISKNGQVCILKWTFSNTPTSGVVMKAIHTLEYSDGENYDKFTYTEIIKTV